LILLAGFVGESATLTNVRVISIVDDDEFVRRATSAFIRSLGYSAQTFASSEEFLASGRVRDSACLIADVQMHGMNGLELQRVLIERGHHLPIIFITAFPSASVHDRALAAGARAVLSKPFSDEELTDCLQRALDPVAAGQR
jgi:FixJ family two-component response regulator